MFKSTSEEALREGEESITMSSQAATTINHFTHPAHPLHLISTHQTSCNQTCSGCKSQATGMVYSCRACNYFLHPRCAKMPQKITHPFDEGHVFILRSHGEGSHKYCNACGKQAEGFCYHCKICEIDLHMLCASTPMTYTHQSHPHQLKLLFSPSHWDKKFNCDVCNTPGSNHWLYRCDICDFDAHLNCTSVPIQPPNMHQHQTNFGAFPNQTPFPQAHTVQQPGFAFSRSAPHQVRPPPQAPHIPPFNTPYAANGFPVNHQGIDPAAVAFLQRLRALSAAQNQMNQQQLQALLSGGRFGGGRDQGLGGIQNLIQAFSGIGNGVGGNIPGLDQLLGNGGGLNFQSLLGGGGGNFLDILGGDGGLSLLNGLDIGGLLGGFSF